MWQFKEAQFRAAIQARLAAVSTADKQFVGAVIGADQSTLENFVGGSALTVDRLCELANLEGFSPLNFFENV